MVTKAAAPCWQMLTESVFHWCALIWSRSPILLCFYSSSSAYIHTETHIGNASLNTFYSFEKPHSREGLIYLNSIDTRLMWSQPLWTACFLLGGGEGRVITEDSYTHILTYTHTHTTKIYKLIHSLTLHCGAFNPLNNGDTNQLKTHEWMIVSMICTQLQWPEDKCKEIQIISRRAEIICGLEQQQWRREDLWKEHRWGRRMKRKSCR